MTMRLGLQADVSDVSIQRKNVARISPSFQAYNQAEKNSLHCAPTSNFPMLDIVERVVPIGNDFSLLLCSGYFLCLIVLIDSNAADIGKLNAVVNLTDVLCKNTSVYSEILEIDYK